MSEINDLAVRRGFRCECSRLELGTSRQTIQSDLRRNVRAGTPGFPVIISLILNYVMRKTLNCYITNCKFISFTIYVLLH